MKIALFLGNVGHDSGGPENYECELVRALARIDCENEFHLLCLFPTAKRVLGIDQPNFRYHALKPSFRPISMTATLPWRVMRIKPTLMHSTFMPPPVRIGPHILTLVCFSMFEHPEFYPPSIGLRLRALTALGVKQGDLLLCISEFVRDRFAQRFKLNAERMPVVPLAASKIFAPQPKDTLTRYLTQQGIDRPYFLFSGRWEPRKNLLGIIEACARFKQKTRAPHRLVLTGKRTWIEREVEELIRKHRLEREVIDVGKTPYRELPQLYAGAEALVYASLYESFGMPIVEAMACGTPVITSNVSAMPETAGGCALLVDPHDYSSIAAAMEVIADSEVLRSSLRQRGLQRAASLTWEATATATLKAYQQLAQAA